MDIIIENIRAYFNDILAMGLTFGGVMTLILSFGIKNMVSKSNKTDEDVLAINYLVGLNLVRATTDPELKLKAKEATDNIKKKLDKSSVVKKITHYD